MVTNDIVSVGIPCYNKPDLLERSVRAVLGQTHRDLDVIISDDVSPDPALAELGRRLELEDPRVRYQRRDENLGPMPNFAAVLRESRGKFFMWAADDDWIEPDFIERCLAEYERATPDTVLVTPEAQYETPEGPYPFFNEGDGVRSVRFAPGAQYVSEIMPHLFGNLIYGVYRREALFHRGKTLIDWIGPTLNELPFFLLLASKGEIRSVEGVGFHKRAPLHVCQAAQWEQLGGRRQEGAALFRPKELKRQAKYLRAVRAEIEKAIDAMEFSEAEKSLLSGTVRRAFRQRLKMIALGFKQRRSPVASNAASIALD